MPETNQYELILNGSRLYDCVSLMLPARPDVGEIWRGEVAIEMPPQSPETSNLLRIGKEIAWHGARVNWEGRYRDRWLDESGRLLGGTLKTLPLQPKPNYEFVFVFERIIPDSSSL